MSVPALRGLYEAPITSRNLKLIERRNMPEKGWGYINRRNGGRRPAAAQGPHFVKVPVKVLVNQLKPLPAGSEIRICPLKVWEAVPVILA